jgi:hypothetical protein
MNKNRSNHQSQHPPTPGSAGSAHREPDHSPEHLAQTKSHGPSLELDRKLKRHDEHHPN